LPPVTGERQGISPTANRANMLKRNHDKPKDIYEREGDEQGKEE